MKVVLAIVLISCWSVCLGQTDKDNALPSEPGAATPPEETSNRPLAQSAELIAYKAKLYHAIQVRWQKLTSEQALIIPAGQVSVQYTVSADGTITTKIIDPGKESDIVLRNISVRAIEGVSPFIPFTDTLREEIGNRYTDVFVFKTK